jgi:(2R)-3-sulfolactate dehydrogenase (NADP+)
VSDPIRLTLTQAHELATAALLASRTSAAAAAATASALVNAEADGQPGHGLSRIPSYALQARAGKVMGHAVPSVEQAAPAALRIDAGNGFAYPAIDLALRDLPGLARSQGIAVAAIHRSHHFGVAGAHAERLARQGLVALVLSNTPKAMAPWGGRRAMLGTNPLAFAAPLGASRAPLVIDLALSVAARGKIVAAQKAGASIPPDWAVDAAGAPTTDPTAALGGALSPIGGAKGAALALMVEVLAAAVTGSSFGWEASSMFDDRDGPPNLGHVLVALDAQRLSAGAFDARMADLVAAVAEESGARLPGERRLAARARAGEHGLALPAALHGEIRALIDSPA